MASSSLVRYVTELNGRIKDEGLTERYLDAYVKACLTAFWEEKDTDYGKEIAAAAKPYVNAFVKKQTGGDIWALDEYCHRTGSEYGLLDGFWEILRSEAVNMDVDSYLLFLEKNRSPDERFYYPRREKFLKHGYVQGLQDLVDDKLDILSISSVPGSGKAQPLYSKVLTPEGYIPMERVMPGTKVISGCGRECTVLGVYPQGKKPIFEIGLADGRRCRCSNEHLWRAAVNYQGAYLPLLLTLDSMRIIMSGYDLWIPVRDCERISYVKLKEISYAGHEECQCIYIDDPTHLYVTDDRIITHNTTLGEMFLSGFMGWNPDLCNLFSSHSGHVTNMVYDVMCNILGTEVRNGNLAEYTWKDIFPDVPIEKTNAKEQEINLGKFKPFKSLTCRALGASQTGVTRCEGLLYCDDLCSGLEMALSKQRLDKLWGMYGSDLKTRKKQGKRAWTCKELHIATRWSVWDVIGRLQRQYERNSRCRFIAVPDIDPDTHESNFEYAYGVGFDVAYFEDMQNTLDNITYECLYKNKPVEREGLLYHPDSLRRYGELPGSIPDAIIAYCDTKDTGTDYNCLGVFRRHGQDYYLVDVVFRNIDPLILDDLNAQCLVRNGVQVAQFESNKEGSRTADKVQTLVKEQGGVTAIQKKYSTVNKETKIIVNSPWVVNHVLFPFAESPEYPDGYKPNSEMGQFMSQLCGYSQLSKNTHDDAPDMVSMLAVDQNPVLGSVSRVEAIRNPLRSGSR